MPTTPRRARQNWKAVNNETRAFLRRSGIPIEPDSGDYLRAALVVLRPHVRAYQAKLERHRGRACPPAAVLLAPAIVALLRDSASLQAGAKLSPCAVCTSIWRSLSTTCSALVFCPRFISASSDPG